MQALRHVERRSIAAASTIALDEYHRRHASDYQPGVSLAIAYEAERRFHASTQPAAPHNAIDPTACYLDARRRAFATYRRTTSRMPSRRSTSRGVSPQPYDNAFAEVCLSDLADDGKQARQFDQDILESIFVPDEVAAPANALSRRMRKGTVAVIATSRVGRRNATARRQPQCVDEDGSASPATMRSSMSEGTLLSRGSSRAASIHHEHQPVAEQDPPPELEPLPGLPAPTTKVLPRTSSMPSLPSISIPPLPDQSPMRSTAPVITRGNGVWGGAMRPKQNQKHRRSATENSLAKEKRGRRDRLSTLMDEAVPSMSKPKAVAVVMSAVELRECLATSLSRVVDLFRQCDADQSGTVDVKEFCKGVHAVVASHGGPTCKRSDVEAIFRDLDFDGSGSLSYAEMRSTLQPHTHTQEPRASAAQQGAAAASSSFGRKRATLIVQPPLPALPKGLEGRGRQMLDLLSQFDKHEDSKPSTGIDSAVSRRLRDEAFEQMVRHFYANEPKHVIQQLLEWVHKVRQARQKLKDARQREADTALIVSLDTDGDGTINIHEFEALSKTFGLSKAQMKARFREKDLGNTGQLDHDQMVQVIRELRDERRLSEASQAEKAGGGGVLGAARSKSSRLPIDLSKWVAIEPEPAPSPKDVL